MWYFLPSFSFNNFLTQGASADFFLQALYQLEVPQPGLELSFSYFAAGKLCEFSAACPDHHKIPSIPEDVSDSRLIVIKFWFWYKYL